MSNSKLLTNKSNLQHLEIFSSEISKKVTPNDRETLLKISSTSMESKLISEDS